MRLDIALMGRGGPEAAFDDLVGLRETGIEVAVRTTAFKNLLRNDVKTALYRIAQESLTNIERHAGASKVEIGLIRDRRDVTLRLSDDGRGFDVQRRSKGNSLGGIGPKNMHERIERLKGVLTIRSSVKGTIVEVKLPHHVLNAPSRDPALLDQPA